MERHEPYVTHFRQNDMNDPETVLNSRRLSLSLIFRTDQMASASNWYLPRRNLLQFGDIQLTEEGDIQG